MLATATAFTAPLIYISNKKLIDTQLQRASEIVNAQLEKTKKLTGKYAEDAAVRAKATAADLQTKVQGYTRKASPATVKSEAPSSAAARDFLNGHSAPLAPHEYPKVPTTEPALDEPLAA